MLVPNHLLRHYPSNINVHTNHQGKLGKKEDSDSITVGCADICLPVHKPHFEKHGSKEVLIMSLVKGLVQVPLKILFHFPDGLMPEEILPILFRAVLILSLISKIS